MVKIGLAKRRIAKELIRLGFVDFYEAQKQYYLMAHIKTKQNKPPKCFQFTSRSWSQYKRMNGIKTEPPKYKYNIPEDERNRIMIEYSIVFE